MKHRIIKQSDPGAAFLEIQTELEETMRRVLKSGWYILGPEVEAFEHEFAAYIGTQYAVGVGTGTDALFLALKAMGIGSGDEVITVSHTAVATVAAIRLAGAVPVFVDIDPKSYTMNSAAIESLISSRTRGIIPVHLYGHPADMGAIIAVAKKHNLAVLEDCAQAHGAAINGIKVGTFGNAGAFSFYPTKNLGAMGDGGCVVTNDDQLAARLRQLRQYGWIDRYVSASEGWNSRLDELHAAILRVLLRRLDNANSRRRALAACYDAILSDVTGVVMPLAPKIVKHVYHQYVVRVPDRAEVMRKLKMIGIGTAIHYPVPIHLQAAYRQFGISRDLEETERLCDEILSLPMFPQLGIEDAKRVAQALCSSLFREC